MNAILDIGSNSVRLMLVADGKTLYKKVCTTRLGQGLEGGGLLSEEGMERTVRAVEAFFREGKEAGASVYAFATAAVRTASNGSAFCTLVEERTGLKVDVVSGEEEAKLAVLGALGGRDGGIVDIGGASTEVCFMRGGKAEFVVSLPIGAVRLYEACGDRPAQLSGFIRDRLAPLGGACVTGPVYGVGGTASTLASLKLGLAEYDAEKLGGLPLGTGWVGETAEQLLALPLEARRALPGMDKSRADIIGGAALLLHEIMQKLGLSEIFFSDRDNLEGYLALRGLS